MNNPPTGDGGGGGGQKKKKNKGNINRLLNADRLRAVDVPNPTPVVLTWWGSLVEWAFSPHEVAFE